MKAMLIGVAALLVVAGVALALLMSGTSDAPAKAPSQPAVTSAGTPTPPSSGTVATPTLTDPAAPPTTAGTTPEVREYMVGDVKVRDHRTGEHKQMDLPPNMHPANGPSLPSELTHDISQQVKQQMIQCSSSMPRDIRGDKPKVEGQLQVAIKDHVLSIHSIVLQVRDITDQAASDALRQCVQEKSGSLTAVAKDQADVADYGIGVTFAIP